MARTLNKLDADELSNQVAELKRNPTKCQVVRKLTAEWVGGTRARVYSGDKQLFIGGEQDFGAMSATLASFLACEVDVIATHATLRGIELEKIVVEGTGEFNKARYMGVANEPNPGFQKVEYTIKIKARNATSEQLAELTKLCETASPVGDTLARHVPISMKILVE